MTSKIASDLQKPNGLSVVRPEYFREIIWRLPVGKINGIGPKAQEKLKNLGVLTIAELAAQPAELLRERFGEVYGLWMHECAHGIDHREVTLHSEPKSISRETTFEHDMHVRRQRDNLTQVLLQLADKLSQDLSRKQRLAKTIGVKVRFADFKSLTRDVTNGETIATPDDILRAARACLKKIPFEEKGAMSTIRLLGVRASHLIGFDDAALEQAARESRRAKGQAQLFLDLEDAP